MVLYLPQYEILKLLLILSVVFAIPMATTMSTQWIMAIAVPTCTQCAKDFTLGQEDKIQGIRLFCNGSSEFAPGQESKIPITCSSCNGKEFAQGQEKKRYSHDRSTGSLFFIICWIPFLIKMHTIGEKSNACNNNRLVHKVVLLLLPNF